MSVPLLAHNTAIHCIITLTSPMTWLKCSDCGCIFDPEYIHLTNTLCQD